MRGGGNCRGEGSGALRSPEAPRSTTRVSALCLVWQGNEILPVQTRHHSWGERHGAGNFLGVFVRSVMSRAEPREDVGEEGDAWREMCRLASPLAKVGNHLDVYC